MVTTPENELSEIHAVLHGEVSEGVERIERALLAIEREPQRQAEHLRSVRAEAHNLKGACSTTGLPVTGAFIHDWESCVHTLGENAPALLLDQVQALYDGLDLIVPLMMLEMGARGDAPATLDAALVSLRAAFGVSLRDPDVATLVQRAAAGLARDDARGMLRVSSDKIDSVMNGAMELLALRGSGARRAHESEALVDVIHQLRLQLRELRGILDDQQRRGGWRGSQLVLDRLRQLTGQQVALGQRAQELGTQLDDGLRVDRQVLSSITDRLVDSTRAIRLIPVNTAFASLHRLVRDVAQQVGREVDFTIEGGETELDRDVLDHVRAAVTHLLRNAIDHGIEAPEERARAGKPRAGRVTVVASSFGGEARIEVIDDGRGISAARVGRAALQKGLVSESDLTEMSESDVRDLVFAPGLSSASEVTTISGRGVGLDAVQQSLEELGGRIRIESEDAVGARFVLTVPVSRASVELLVVRCGEQLMALPASRIARILRVHREHVARLDTGLAIDLDGQPVPIAHLHEILEVPGGTTGDHLIVLVIEAGQRRVGVTVDAVLDHRESLAKGLGEHLGRVPNVLGTTVLADGEVLPILDPSDLFRNATTAGATAELADDGRRVVAPQRRVLVVDDSITTRTLQKGILESAGYKVFVATDGVEALEKLATTKVELVVTDVEMPRLDGIGLTERIKGAEATRMIPVIVVSSLGSSDHRARGLNAGADAYIAKGEFDQGQLLATIERLL